jgi:hypothetical protein
MLDQYLMGESVFYFAYTTNVEVKIQYISLVVFDGFCTGELSPVAAAAHQP